MPITKGLLQSALLRLNVLPPPVIEAVATGVYRSMTVAIRTGIIEELESGPRTAEELAEKLALNSRGVTILCELLEIGGYLEKKKGGRYSNTSVASNWLSRSSKKGMADTVLFWEQLLASPFFGEYLEDALRDGTPKQHLYDWCLEQPRRWDTFNNGLISYAGQLTADACRAVEPLPAGGSRFLDVGGNHGLYSVEFCRKFPQWTGQIIDLPEALEVGKAVVAKEGLSDRISCVPKDITKEAWGSDFDVVLFINTLHYFSGEQCADVIERAAAAMSPNGLLVVTSQLTDGGPIPAGTAMARVFSMVWYSGMGGMAHTPQAISGWFERAGLQTARQVKARDIPGLVFLVARKPG